MVAPILFTGARLIDPAGGTETVGDLLVAGGVIAAVGRVESPPAEAQRIDAAGRVLAPGLVDAGVFRADVAASRAGGITRMVLMPDQSPPLDDPALVERATRIGKPDAWVHPLAAATRGLAGRELAEVGLMHAAGAVGIATGRGPIADAAVMHRLMLYAAGFDLVVVTHAEEPALTAGAVASEGEHATRMGLSAAPALAEALAVARDLRLAEATGCRLHIRQVTTAESVELVRAAKRRGVRATAGVTPAHLFLSDTAMVGFRTFARLSPPLRSEGDRLALLDAVADGTIDVIASGHDPRTQEDKRLPFADAQPGMAGAATLLPLALGLVRDGRMTLPRLLARLTLDPARLFGLPGGRLAPGEPADLVLFDEGAPWRIEGDKLPGAGDNTPFDGLPTQGRVVLTMKGGAVSPPV